MIHVPKIMQTTRIITSMTVATVNIIIANGSQLFLQLDKLTIAVAEY